MKLHYFFFFHDPLVDLKKRKERQEIMPDSYVHIYVVYLPLLLYCGALIEIIGCPGVSKT